MNGEVAHTLGITDEPQTTGVENQQSSIVPEFLQNTQKTRAMLARAQAISLSDTEEEVLGKITQLCSEQIHADHAAAWTLQEDGSVSLYIFQSGDTHQVLDKNNAPMAQLVSMNGVVTRYDNPDEYETKLEAPVKHPGAFMGAPIDLDNEIIGGIYLIRKDTEPPFSPMEQTVLEYMVTFAAIGLGYRESLGREERRSDQAIAARKLQSDFLSMVSHDLKGPLTSIRGYADILHSHGSALEEEQREQMLRIIMDQGERIERLVDGLLDIARIESGALKINRNPVDIREIISSLVGVLPKEHDVRVDLAEEPLIVLGDRTRLEQIISNLLNNSLKYGAAPHEITAELGEGDEPSCVKITIADHGEGVSEEIKKNMYTRFAPGAKNIGLGLSIVNAMVHAHEGRIEYHDREPHGAVFVVCLPLAHPE